MKLTMSLIKLVLQINILIRKQTFISRNLCFGVTVILFAILFFYFIRKTPFIDLVAGFCNYVTFLLCSIGSSDESYFWWSPNLVCMSLVYTVMILTRRNISPFFFSLSLVLGYYIEKHWSTFFSPAMPDSIDSWGILQWCRRSSIDFYF